MSNSQSITPSTTTITTTASVVCSVSARVGQTTLRTSICASCDEPQQRAPFQGLQGDVTATPVAANTPNTRATCDSRQSGNNRRSRQQQQQRNDQFHRVESGARGFDFCIHNSAIAPTPFVDPDSPAQFRDVRLLSHRSSPGAYLTLQPGSRFQSSPPATLAGQEGIEPPTCGFGDRRSAN